MIVEFFDHAAFADGAAEPRVLTLEMAVPPRTGDAVSMLIGGKGPNWMVRSVTWMVDASQGGGPSLDRVGVALEASQDANNGWADAGTQDNVSPLFKRRDQGV